MEGRPPKRQKTEGGSLQGQGQSDGKGKGVSRRRDPARSKYRHQAATSTSASASGSSSNFNSQSNSYGKHGTMISASGLQSGDVGIFVTSDKGCEKRALRELEDLLEELIGEQAREGDDTLEADVREIGAPKAQASVEDDIEAELAALRGQSTRNGNHAGDGTSEAHHQRPQQTQQSRGLGLITLDIPCVSFIRLPTSSSSEQLDPVDLVYHLCRTAYNDPRPRSRFIKRLTPITRVKKVMNDGIDKLCEEVLPPVFGQQGGNGKDGESHRGWKYAVRVTVRNNNQISKDEVIKKVAEYVVQLGRGDVRSSVEEEMREERRNTSSEESDSDSDSDSIEGDEGGKGGKNAPASKVSSLQEIGEIETEEGAPSLEHKVDLKRFEKLILVEIYRNVVGMSVVGEATEFDGRLKRFNLSEIYTEGRKRADAEKGAVKEKVASGQV